MSIAARRLQRAQQSLGYRGTSIGPGGHRIAEMFGGDGNGSWINTPMPANTAVHPQSATAVADLVLNVREHATGNPSLTAWPTLATDNWNASINVIDSSQYPLQPVQPLFYLNQPSAWSTHAMMLAGFPLPPGLQPTDDGDGTIHLYDPDWVWLGRPTDPQYKGRIWELWGARSPEQNAADGLDAVWTAKHAGRMTGVNNRLNARMTIRTWQTDVTRQTDVNGNPMPGAYAPKASHDTSANAGYWGYGPDGVAEVSTWLASASHLSMSHHQFRIRDLVEGVIKHPLGFALYPYNGTIAPNVWPSTGYDGSSRPHLPNGARLRLPYNYVGTPPTSLPAAQHALWHMFVTCFRDYGIIHVDMTGNSFGMRAETGIRQHPAFPNAGWDGRLFLQSLPWEDMQMLVVGNNDDFYPAA